MNYPSINQRLDIENEKVWMKLGQLADAMNEPEKAIQYYERVLQYNQYNVPALTSVASIYRMKDPPDFPKAVEYYHRALQTEDNNTEIWGNLGHCFLMMDDLTKAYTAYHQAIYNAKLQNKTKQDPHLWYGIGILYERYNSLDNAEEAFRSVLKMDAQFEKINEIYFRLGIIYKQQKKYEQSLECFGRIRKNPPPPLTEADIWFQIGHVYELKKDFQEAKNSYEKVLQFNSNHSKVLQQLGWLYHQNTEFQNQDIAIHYLQRSIDADPNSGQTWYLLGRCFMAQKKYRYAYNAYQQAVFRDGKNPTFWCSIGVLYYQINQYRDALDAYTRAIRLNPYLSEVWYDLGTLYESCNQIPDALDAYQRAADLDQNNEHIQQRLIFLKSMDRSNPPSEESKNLTAVEPPTAASQYQSGGGFFSNNAPSMNPPPSNVPSGSANYQNTPYYPPPTNAPPPKLSMDSMPPSSAHPPSMNGQYNASGSAMSGQSSLPPVNLPPTPRSSEPGVLPPPTATMSTGGVNDRLPPPQQYVGATNTYGGSYPPQQNPPKSATSSGSGGGGFGPVSSQPQTSPQQSQFSAGQGTPYAGQPPSYTYPPQGSQTLVPPSTTNLGETSPLKRRLSPLPQPSEHQSDVKRVKQTPKNDADSEDDEDEQDQMVIHEPEDSEPNSGTAQNSTPKIVGTASDVHQETEPPIGKAKSRFVRAKKLNDNSEEKD
ncbi:hypothetical protein FDP41_005073 [Naegleria fowleri]|uniref:Uncharacterized protein n=1 Tax=Naegleria fowleri TaxID=5763 RepID=A0A6A5BLF9_NAEFO|nr:uncharacterized protein FDP41_005073 [Naegleria fowleri]KAF0975746.1 hypothetical protein FDP41_005073 [Naegleria fowleri]CAG4709875.1 unnamed protein product [Naegleria fowleri]